MRTFLINASNLHIGGGVQVAVSIIGELTRMSNLPLALSVWASTEVDDNLRKLGYDLSRLPSYEVQNSYGIKLLFSSLNRRLQTFSVVLTIFGPLYVLRLSGRSLVGFAQPWIIYPENEIASSYSWLKRSLTKLKFYLQSVFFSKADILLVELEHVRNGLVNRGIKNEMAIRVVHNCLSSLYFKPETWHAVNVPFVQCDIRLGFVGRNYSHKNTSIFPLIIYYLKLNHSIKASIYVTFNNEEWDACDEIFREAVTNVGPLLVAQCPYFYKKMDAVIFPSLLECFSVTPLESMAMERPLFASDRSFNRDICGDYAHYFDPLDPINAAECIAEYLKQKSIHPHQASQELQAARKHALELSNSTERAQEYLQCLLTASFTETKI